MSVTQNTLEIAQVAGSHESFDTIPSLQHRVAFGNDLTLTAFKANEENTFGQTQIHDATIQDSSIGLDVDIHDRKSLGQKAIRFMILTHFL
jgi:hypothetical protein